MKLTCVWYIFKFIFKFVLFLNLFCLSCQTMKESMKEQRVKEKETNKNKSYSIAKNNLQGVIYACKKTLNFGTPTFLFPSIHKHLILGEAHTTLGRPDLAFRRDNFRIFFQNFNNEINNSICLNKDLLLRVLVPFSKIKNVLSSFSFWIYMY